MKMPRAELRGERFLQPTTVKIFRKSWNFISLYRAVRGLVHIFSEIKDSNKFSPLDVLLHFVIISLARRCQYYIHKLPT